MAGLGNYTLSPQLGGGVFAYHTAKALSKAYPDKIVFMRELRKYDFGRLQIAIIELLALCRKCSVYGYYRPGGATARHRILSAFTENIKDLRTQSPERTAQVLNEMIETFPQFACTGQKYDKEITDNVLILSDYYGRYLAAWFVSADKFLSA